MYSEIKETSKTKDIYFAAVLLSLGYELHGVNKKDIRHQEFEFIIHQTTFDGILTEYTNSTLQVNANNFKNAIQRMKTVVHSF